MPRFSHPNDREIIHQLLDDAAIIEEMSLTAVPKPATIRTSMVPMLRRWIAEGLFFRAQRLILPDLVKFSIHKNTEDIQLCKEGKYANWMEIMVFGSVGIASGQVAPEHLGPDGRATFEKKGDTNTSPELHKPSDFFDQPILFWRGEFYTRADVIKMHANALGGVHFDFKQTDAMERMLEIKNYRGYEIKERNNIQMLVSAEIPTARDDPKRRQYVYDATEIVAIDTAATFAKGIRDSEASFMAILK